MKRITNFKHNYLRTLFVLLAVWLTAATAWADDITVTYNIGYTGIYRTAFIKRADNESLKVTWDNGISTLWPGNETHGVDDEYDITIRPSVDLNSHDYIFTTENNTSFTITTASSNHYLIKSVVFKNNDNNTVGSSNNVNAQTTTVSVSSGKDIVHLTVTLSPDPAHFSVNDAGTEYTVKTAGGWGLFCDAVNSGTDFIGKTVKLDADISVNRMVGTSDHKFSGTFDGQGHDEQYHTLTFNQGTSNNPYNDTVAPFCYVNGATIQNLHTTGNIYTSYKFAGGIIASSTGNVTLTNCRSSMVINSSVSGDGTHGGLIGVSESGPLNIYGCLFDGSLLGTNTIKCGGFIGWRNGTANIYNSLFAPAEVTVGNSYSATFARNDVDTYNCYFTYLLNDGTNYKPELANGSVSPKKYHNGQNAYWVTTESHLFIITGDSTVYNVSGITSYNNRDLLKYQNNYYAGLDETVTVGIEEGYTTTTPTVTGVTVTVNDDGTWSFPMPAANVTVSATTGFDPAHFSYDGVDTCTIYSATGWGVFCDMLANNDKGIFDNKTVKLGADITVTRMAGGSYHDFTGTFDGQGHTLTVSYGTAESPIDAQYVAPFPNTTDNGGSQPTFRNLTIDGHIYSTYTTNTEHKHTGGLIGHLYGTVTIEHCVSNVEITATGGQSAGGFVGLCENTVSFTDCVSSAVIHSADSNNGGFVAWSRDNGYAINFTGCLFNGKILQINGSGNSNGGFIGWKGDSKTVTITDCLYAPAVLAEGEAYASDNSATFSCQHSQYPASITNCYYTRTFGDTQGQLMYSINPAQYITITFDGTATAHNVSGITAYTMGENINPGLKYNDTCYSASGNTVSLILDAEAGHYFSGYTANAGTLETTSINLSTAHCQLTMPNEDVTITGTPATEYNIVYDLDGGTLPDVHPTTYTSQTPTFTLVNPTKQFYEFIGWTGTGLTEPTETVTIAQGSTGHRTYTAHWQALCPEPTGVGVTHVTQTTAKLNWTAGGSESSWDIFVTTNANEVPDENTTQTTLNSQLSTLNLTGLTPGTTYYAYVRANCVNHSLWSDPVVFNTLCNAVSLPYSEDFNSGELSHCWTTHVYDHYNSSIDIRDNALSFRIGNNNIMAAVLPGMVETINLNAYQISFDACYANFDNTHMTSGKVVIGIMTDPNDLATFIPIKEVGITDGYPTYGRYKVWLNHYTGTSGHYIAIKNSYVRNGYVLVDNIEVTELPDCLEPTDLAVATESYDVTVTWESDAIGATYDVAFSTTATENPESYIVEQTTNTTYNFTSTQYGDNYVYVRAHCGENNYSEWAGTHFVIGYCAPYIQNHDGKGIIGVRFGSGEQAVNHYDPNGIPSSKPYYGDYSTLVGDIVANTDDTIYITTNTINDDGGEFHYVIAIWVDLDKDLLFEDDEMLCIDEAVEGNGTLKAPIVIPANTPEGDYRMRIYGADEYLNDFYNNGFINWDAPHDVCYGAEYAHACDFTVHVIAATPPCRPPIDLGTTISVDGNQIEDQKLKAVLRWKSNSATPESNWTLYWKKSSDNAYTEESISDTPTYTLTALDTNTDYEFYVLANCDVNEESAPSKVCHFTTPCYPVNVPWSEDFDDLTEAYSIPNCWDNSEGTVTEASYKWCFTSETNGFGACNGTSHNGSKCVRFNSVDPSNRQTNYLKSVPVNLPADTPMQLTFWYKNPSGGDYSVLLSTDGGNTCDTLLVTGLRAFEWTQSYPIYLHRYRGQMVVFVFKGTSNHGADDSFLYLDDVVVSTADDCTPPVAVTASAASNSAVLNWIGNTESAWTVYYKRKADQNYSSTPEITTKPPYTLGNLENNTDYEFYVKANCSSTSASDPSETISFHTLCGAILVTADNPYTENFETTMGVTNHTAVGHVPGCWDIDPSGAEVKVLNKGAEMNFTDNETGSQVLYFYGNKVYNFAALPVFENSLRSLEISFKYAFESGQDPQNTSLTLGFIFPGDKGFNTFDTIAYITPYNQSNFQEKVFYEVTKNLKYEVPDRATRLVFRWEPPTDKQIGCNIDDIEVRLGIDTIGKTIVGYGDDPTAGRWYLIANPWYGSRAITATGSNLVPTDNNDSPLISSPDYDLYRFDQAEEKEWQNFKAHYDDDENPFNSLVNGQGYLYANRDNVTLNFCGQPYIGDGKVRLTKVESVPLSGWNLVGNPFTEDATVNKDFYRMNDDGDEIITDPYNPIVHLTEGIFVHANSYNDSVQFTPVSQGAKGRSESRASVVLNLLSENTGNVIDRAIVRMDEGETLPKLQIRDNSTKIYIPQKGKDYAIVTSDGQGEMPVNFRPNENGLYTITVNLENVEMEYLHLIDNLTGADIDLLFMPEYTFTARTTDYESRFKLVFSSNEDGPSTDSDTFAFISNGDIIITADTHDATLQVIDVMGRVIYQRDAMNRVSTGGMIKGVYVLRLIERDSVRTQKIVIE